MALFNGVFDNTPFGSFLGTGSPIEGIFNPSSWWDNFKNGRTNEVNQEIANQNLQYQKERNAIEDERYRDETLYNRNFAEEEQAYQRMFAQNEQEYQRKFAEDERAYNRALQQKLFEREDTALERQASSLSAMGINPLSQQLNGLGAGQAVSSSLPGSVSAGFGSPGSMSSRGGSALHNDFRMQDQGMLPTLSALSGLASVVNGISTGEYQRDSLALQNDKQFLENLKTAHDLGLRNYKVGSIKRGTSSKKFDDSMSSYSAFADSFGSAFINGAEKSDEYEYKKSRHINNAMDSKIRFANELANMDFSRIATDIMTNALKTKEDLGEKFKKDFGEKNNPFAKFFSLFF